MSKNDLSHCDTTILSRYKMYVKKKSYFFYFFCKNKKAPIVRCFCELFFKLVSKVNIVSRWCCKVSHYLFFILYQYIKNTSILADATKLFCITEFLPLLSPNSASAVPIKTERAKNVVAI